jgi:hypothetical protein
LKNRIVHDYFLLEFEIIWNIVQNDIPVLEAFYKNKLSELQDLKINIKSSSGITDPDPDPTPTPRFKS